MISNKRKKELKRKPNIIDVARKAGVSQGTVSNYLNNSAPVNINTANNIAAAINELNYIPDSTARSLRSGKTRLIGIIIPELSDPYYSLMADGIAESAYKNNYSIIIACNNYNYDQEKIQIQNLLSNNMSGFIFCCGGEDENLVNLIIENDIPVAVIDRKIKDEKIYSVEIDNFKSFLNATTYLIKNGHRDIFYFSEPLSTEILKDRLNGYKTALKENGIEIDESKIIIDKSLQKDRPYGGYEIMKNLIKKNTVLPGAVISTADAIAYGAMKAVFDSGFKVPQDISFIGNNDSYLSKFVNPSLTTIRQPIKDMGEAGMDMIIKLLNKEIIPNKKLIFETVLVERDSVRNININKYLRSGEVK